MRSRRNIELKLLLSSTLVVILFSILLFLPPQKIPYLTIIPAAVIFILIFSSTHLILRYTAPNSDPIILPLICLLSGLGLVMIYRLSPHLAFLQFFWIIIGAITLSLIILTLKNYRVLESYKYSLGLIGLILLVSTLRLGKGFFEPNLWLKIGPFSFQPSEISKILITIFFAAYLKEKRELLSIFTRKIGSISVPDFKHLGPVLLFWLISLGLLIIQKDLGASLLFFGLFIVMLYIATSREVYIGIGGLLFLIGAALSASLFSHVSQRIQIWLNPWSDVSGKSFQLVQSLLALASGGFWGSGLGHGFPHLIPAVTTDFIFSAFGEEIGFIGVVALIALYLIIIARGFKIALKTSDDFGKLLAAGLTAVFALQTFVIIGGVTRIVPLTGITLPFVSYGGSSILANFILVGILLSISNQSIEEESVVK